MRYTGAVSEQTNVVEQYVKQVDELQQLLAACPPAKANARPALARWSVVEIVNHLADAETIAAVRLRRIITQDRPWLQDYAQEVWAERLAYQQQEVGAVAERFCVLRRANAGLLRQLPAALWNLTGQHDQYGEMTLAAWLADYLGHTAKHLQQIRAVLAELN
jgi:uncharacterized damage-inducible protein DinB